VPSASDRPSRIRYQRPLARSAAVAACAALIAAGTTGCETTQEKAAAQQARAAHILEARAKRKRAEHADGTKGRHNRDGSAHRRRKEGQ
jgi:hypothetical protein